MKIIIAPAKKMRADPDGLPWESLPEFLGDAERLRDWMRGLSYPELKKLWACNEKIARENFERLQGMDLHNGLTPAILAYDGIQYKYMLPSVFTYGEFDYIREHLRILSGFYGLLRPMDGVAPYRLEMQAKVNIDGCKNLSDFWGDRLYHGLRESGGVIINLASQEYAKAIELYLCPEDRYITCVFGEMENGKVVQKGVYAKMARGEMVRFLAVNRVQSPEEMTAFKWGGYRFEQELSSETEYVFLRSERRPDAAHALYGQKRGFKP